MNNYRTQSVNEKKFLFFLFIFFLTTMATAFYYSKFTLEEPYFDFLKSLPILSIKAELSNNEYFFTANQQVISYVTQTAKIGLIYGVLISSLLITIVLFFMSENKVKLFEKENILSGVNLVKNENNIKKYEKSNYHLIGVYYPKMAEHQHTFISGAPGVGKSQFLGKLLRQIRESGDFAIVYDTADLMSQFYKNGDKILNPLDERSVNFDPISSIKSKIQAKALAASVIKNSGENSNSFFADAARTVFAELVILATIKNISLSEIVILYKKSNINQLKELLRDTEAAIYLNEPKTWTSISSTLNNAITQLEYLPKINDFDLKKSVLEDDKWIWLTANEATKSINYPLISMYLELCGDIILSSNPEHQKRKIWLILDEMPSLPKLETIPRLLAQGRKFGVCGILGIQAISQLKEVYGTNAAQSLQALCSTHVVFRAKDGETAEAASKNLGTQVVEETSFSDSLSKDGRTASFSTKAQERDTVPAGTIQALENMSCFISMPALPVVGPVSVKYEKPNRIFSQFEEKKGIGEIEKHEDAGFGVNNIKIEF